MDTLHQYSLPELQGLQISALTNYEQLGPFAAQVVYNSRQPHIRHYAPRDAAPGGRFENDLQLRRWLHFGKFVFLLTEGDTLAGISWFSYHKRTSGYDVHSLTYGLRIYEDYVGRGLAFPFMRVGHEAMDNVAPQKTIWLNTDEENTKAIHVYERFGYKHVDRRDGRVVMVYDRRPVL